MPESYSPIRLFAIVSIGRVRAAARASSSVRGMPEAHDSPLAQALRDDALERFLRYVRIDTQCDARLGDLSEHAEAARPLAAARRRAARARARRRRPRPSTATCSRRCPASSRGRRSGWSRTSTRAPTRPATESSPQVHATTTAASSCAGLSPATSGAARASGSGTTSSPPTGRRCSAPTTRPASPRSWPRSPASSRTPRCPRAPARIAFTVDEEVGRGVDHFDLEAFGADFAYTLDGVGRRRDRERDVLGASSCGDHPRRRRPSRHGEGQARQRDQARRRGSSRACRRTRSRRRRPRGARDSSTRTRSRAAPTSVDGHAHPARLRAGAARGARGAACGGSREEAIAAEPRASVDVRALGAVPQHARRRSTRRPHVVEAALEAARRAGLEPTLHVDPRRHRRLAAHRDGPADAEHLHRRQRVPLACASGSACRTCRSRRGDGRRAAASSGPSPSGGERVRLSASDRLEAAGRIGGPLAGRRPPAVVPAIRRLRTRDLRRGTELHLECLVAPRQRRLPPSRIGQLVAFVRAASSRESADTIE